jgi:hypothetical protein
VIFFVVLSAFFLLPSQIKDTSAQISFYPANVSQNITMVSYKIPANTSLYMITLQEM